MRLETAVLVSAGPDGKFVYEQIPDGVELAKYIASKGGYPVPTCPKCLVQRNLPSETEAERIQYEA